MSRAVSILWADPETGPYSALGGGYALVVAAASGWLSGEVLPISGAFLGGLVAGYLAGRIGAPAGPAGFRAGLIGWLPALLVGTEVLRTGAEADAGGQLVRLAVAAATTAVLLVVGAFIGAFGGRLGGWLAEQRGYPRQPVEAR